MRCSTTGAISVFKNDRKNYVYTSLIVNFRRKETRWFRWLMFAFLCTIQNIFWRRTKKSRVTSRGHSSQLNIIRTVNYILFIFIIECQQNNFKSIMRLFENILIENILSLDLANWSIYVKTGVMLSKLIIFLDIMWNSMTFFINFAQCQNIPDNL